jgi:hypothetical protein
MMSPTNPQEDAKLDAMQRSWQSRRSRSSLFDDISVVETELLSMPQAPFGPKPTFAAPQRVAPTPRKEEEVDAYTYNFHEEVIPEEPELIEETPSSVTLDASALGDFPAVYTICAVEPHQMPVVGVYTDRRIVPGFKYRVRPLPEIGETSPNKCMFNEQALTLKSIGRGYARRFTFDATTSLNNNDNYFWSDNRPEGYAFELEVISEGDKFTIFDSNKEAQGTVEVLQLEVSVTGNVPFSFEIVCVENCAISATCFYQKHPARLRPRHLIRSHT